ncbi:hypothetical protein, partial [Neptunomonas phycophila]|uniref:hypothetical protein n=1 Tax=Neptunomonas phycophila TaxID=1572645 RepID=UPI0023FA0966
YWHPYMKMWVVDSSFGIKRFKNFKQAQVVARQALWEMNKEQDRKSYSGQIFYSRKSDGLVTLNEYIGFDDKGWSTIKGERMNLRKSA